MKTDNVFHSPFRHLRKRALPCVFAFSLLLANGLLAATWTGQGDAKSWNDPANWDGNAIPTGDQSVTIPSGATVYAPSAESGSLTIAKGATLFIGCTGEVGKVVCPDLPESSTARLLVNGSMTLGGTVAIGGLNNRYPQVHLTVSDALTLTDGAALHIYSSFGPQPDPSMMTPATFDNGGASITVSGKTTLEGASTIYPYSHQISGLSPKFILQDLEIGPQAAFSADLAGWGLVDGVRHGLGMAPGGYGGAYGGIGGGNNRRTYGFAKYPLYPGSPAGDHASRGIEGGGKIDIRAKNVTLNGSLHANGQQDRPGNSVTTGSGGAVFLQCTSFTYGAEASIEARGGYWTGYSHNCGAGGRVAILIGLPTSGQIQSLRETGEADGIVTLTDDMAGPTSPYPGLVSVQGGHGQSYDTQPTNPRHGQDGTSVLMTVRGDKPFLTVDGDQFVASTPVFGVHETPAGTTTLAAPETHMIEGSLGFSRYVCTGYVWTNALGETGSGTTATAELDLQKDTTLVWKYGRIEHFCQVTAAGQDLVEGWHAVGSVLSAEAPADYEGGVFAGWEGDVEEAARLTPAQSLAVTRPLFLAAAYQPAAGATPTENTWTGAGADTRWETAANWSAGRAPGPYDAVTIPASAQIDVFTPVVVHSLTVGNDAFLHFLSTGKDFKDSTSQQPLAKDSRQAIALRTTGDLVLDGAKLSLGGENTQALSVRLLAGGDLKLLGKAVHASYGDLAKEWQDFTWQEFKAGGALVSVSGTASLEGTSALYVCNNRKSGLGVVFDLQDLSIAEGAKIDGYARGWGWADYVFHGPGYSGSGGAYGGNGGGNNTKTYGFLKAPFQPGSPGGRADARFGGGASIRIDAKDIWLAGSIQTTGSDMAGDCGSGGSIWITCSTLTPTETAVLSARGGQWSNYSHSCGGGGRIAVMTGTPTEEQIDALYETGECENALLVLTDPKSVGDIMTPFSVNVDGGHGQRWDANPALGWHGKDGTFAWMMNRGNSVAVTVAGSLPGMTAEPPYGVSTIDRGPATFSATAPCLDPAFPGTVRYTPTGFTWTNANGESGTVTGTEGTIDLTADTQIFWNWGKRENLVTIETRGEGTATESQWIAEGGSLVLEATPGAGSVFLGWAGDISEALRDRPAAALPVDAPKTVLALFSSGTGEEHVWKAETTGSWFEPANWLCGTLPSPGDAVVVSNGTCLVEWPATLRPGSLALGGKGSLYLGCTGKTAQVAFPLDIENESGYLLAVKGLFSVSNDAQVAIGARNGEGDAHVTAGDLLLSQKAVMAIWAGRHGSTNDIATYREGGASISVAGELSLRDRAVLELFCHRESGAPVVIDANVFSITNRAVVDADFNGFGRVGRRAEDGSWAPIHFGPYVKNEYQTGASHGGLGGWAPTNACYGSAAAPYRPGATAHDTRLREEVHEAGGGAIRIDADRAYLHGTLSANGIRGHETHSNGGGAAGGSIWLTARKIEIGEGAMLQAKGGDGNSYNGGSGGGGGRIAIARGLSRDQIARCYETGRCGGISVTPLAELPAYADHFSVAGGWGKTDENGQPGSEGTAVFILPPPGATLLMLR